MDKSAFQERQRRLYYSLRFYEICVFMSTSQDHEMSLITQTFPLKRQTTICIRGNRMGISTLEASPAFVYPPVVEAFVKAICSTGFDPLLDMKSETHRLPEIIWELNY
jgi:hypothetical protein